ncbi:cytochrome P450 734A5-like isoform X2 [Phragmites australis]|uniref:cytochrome P450 734A5-like isoform X2 n=1 Tax=Phragmites australis TaxID=29695 RepID=UPI002D790D82|nr:cytochrome P450 734A5-like isoform X2 [Phragmites australis]
MWWPWQWSALAAAAACFCLHVAAARLMEALWWRPRRLERHFARHGVHGPGYRFFVGSSIELIRLMVDASSRPAPPEAPHDVLPRVLAFYHHWRKLYGPKFLIWFGSTPRLTISEPELIREVLLSRAEHFDRYEAPPLVCQFEGYGLTNLHGDEWARRRKTLAPAFHTENLKRLVPFVGETVQRMLEERVLEAAGGGEVEVDVTEWYPRLPQEAITLATFGRNFDEGSVVFRLLDEHASYATEAHTKVFIPGYRFLPTRRNRRVWKLDRGIRRLLARFVAGMQSRGGDRQGERREDGGGVRDFMSFMAPAMTADKIIEECKNIFFAGKETLTNLLTWATVALAMHPEWQDRARWEVLAVCGRRGLPTKDHLPKLKTLGMIVNETLRLYPPAVAIIRKTKRDVELGGCVVPAGTEILIPIMAVHHDTNVWGADATEFNPARFADSEAGNNRPRHPMAFMPFGGGARVCIGQNLALMEVKVALAVVLQRCEFRLSPAYVHAPQVPMILNPQHGAPVIFRPL